MVRDKLDRVSLHLLFVSRLGRLNSKCSTGLGWQDDNYFQDGAMQKYPENGQPPTITAQAVRPTSQHLDMSPIGSENDKGATGAAKFVTSTVGNTVGGLGRTVGGVVGAGGRGLGQTITGATGSAGKPVGEAIESLGNGVENGANGVSKGVEDAGKWK
ncbi:MAG: hypothetical protein Q9205_004590 [Flavoplaca limonia]